MKIDRKQKDVLLRVLAVLLLTVMTLPLLVACNGDGQNEGKESEAGENSATLNGTPIGDYEIIFSWHNQKGEQQAAKQVQKGVAEAFGVTLKIKDDSAGLPQKAIVIGDADKGDVTAESQSLENREYCVTVEGDRIYLLAITAYGFERAAEDLCNTVATAGSNTVTVATGEKQSYADDILNTMTFNIYNWDTGDDHLGRIQSVIKTNAADTIGFQEITEEWIDRIMADEEISAMYGCVGADRGDHTHEQAAIFYRKDKFDLIDSGTRWLYGEDGSVGSDTVGGLVNDVAELTNGGTKLYYRVYTYALLERKNDHQKMVFINTHLELSNYTSVTYPDEESIKNKQIDYVLNFAKEMQAAGYPVILTGDFNAQATSVVGKKILAAGFVRTEAEAKTVIGTEVTDTYKNEDRWIGKGIDHIYLLAEKGHCESYTILNKKIMREYPSDHLPRIATCVIP